MFSLSTSHPQVVDLHSGKAFDWGCTCSLPELKHSGSKMVLPRCRCHVRVRERSATLCDCTHASPPYSSALHTRKHSLQQCSPHTQALLTPVLSTHANTPYSSALHTCKHSLQQCSPHTQALLTPVLSTHANTPYPSALHTCKHSLQQCSPHMQALLTAVLSTHASTPYHIALCACPLNTFHTCGYLPCLLWAHTRSICNALFLRCRQGAQ